MRLGEIGVADDHDAVVGDDALVRDGQVAVAAPLRGEVDDHRARLHHLDHVPGPELGRGPPRDQGRGDDDVDLRGEFAGISPAAFHGIRGRTARRSRRSRRCPARFPRIRGRRTRRPWIRSVRTPRGGRRRRRRWRPATWPCRWRRDRATPAPTTSTLAGGTLPAARDLTGEEAAEIVAGLDHGAVARDVGHGAERVHLLRPADPRDHVHGDHVRALWIWPARAMPRSGRARRTRSEV